LASGDVAEYAGGDEQASMVANALGEATGRGGEAAEGEAPARQAIVLGSGNLGLVYLMDAEHRLTLEEIERRHPRLIPALREHPHIGWLLVRSEAHGAVVLGAGGGEHRLADGAVSGADPLAPFSGNAPAHLRRTDGFGHVADLMIGAFYDPDLDESCAFEELISFHGGLGGPQTRPFILHPERLRPPDEPLVGAAAVHRVLAGWRTELAGRPQ
jgi:hypothetical protein